MKSKVSLLSLSSLVAVSLLAACSKAPESTVQAPAPAASVPEASVEPVTPEKDFPAVVFDMGGKFDKSFNQGIFDGVEKFKTETQIGYREFEVTNPAQRDQAISKFASDGAKIVLGVGFAQGDAIGKAAQEHPNTRFALIDGFPLINDKVVDAPNVRSIVFKEQEGSFLVGMVAALKSQSGKVGFVGGMDIPLIRAFGCGYEQGAKYANPKVEVTQNMTGTTPEAWSNPSKGSELAKAQFDKGVDVVFAAAGGTGIGVYQAAKDNKKFAIGVDSNQNYLHPGTMLTSMVKRVDVAAYEAFKDGMSDNFTTGIRVLGLAEGGVDWALDENNASLISEDMKAKVEQAKQDIISGKIKVHDYRENNSCK